MTPLDWQISTAPGSRELLANIPEFFDADSELSLLDQNPLWESAPPDKGFMLSADNFLILPNDIALEPIAFAQHLGETIYVYKAGFLAIVSPDGAFKVVKLEK